MSTTTLNAYLDFSTHYTDASLEDLQALLEEICDLTGYLKLPMYEYDVQSLVIELDDRDEAKQWFNQNQTSKSKVLKVGVQVGVPDRAKQESVGGEVSEIKGEQAEQIHRFLARTIFEKRLWDLIAMGNVACVGVLNLVKGVIVQDGRLCSDTFHNNMSVTILWDTYGLADKMNWPKLHRIDFDKVWQWAVGVEGFLDGFSNSPVSRALNAFTQILRAELEYQPMQLFWALVGIEALYVKGSYALLQQVREKSQVFLGPQQSFKKQINQMYDFRSRFVHGDLDFPGSSILFDASQEVMRFDENLIESTALAVAILLATIQELIQRGWNGLGFSYVASDTSR